MMRLHLKLSPNRQPVNFDHLPVLAGALHKWLGPNEEHDELSLYSFSWLQGAKPGPGGLQFPRGATWFISSVHDDFLVRSIQGILSDPDIRWGMQVQECSIARLPEFPEQGEVRFLCASPIFIKRTVSDASRPSGENHKFFLYSDPESDGLLTETLQRKLRAAGLDDAGVSVRFDREYLKARTKMVHYRGIDCRASECPVYVRGSAKQLMFAWTVGMGNSTGVGLGSLVVAPVSKTAL